MAKNINDYKRKTRKMSDKTKMKISNTLKGRKKSLAYREAISEGLKRAWLKIPYNLQ